MQGSTLDQQRPITPNGGARPTPGSPTVCAAHPGSLIRRYRTHGPNGPGVYPQCVPMNGSAAHLLEWATAPAEVSSPGMYGLSPAEQEILDDAAEGLTVAETARKRLKGVETVKTQRRSILLKLDARNIAHAVSLASRNGLLGAASMTS